MSGQLYKKPIDERDASNVASDEQMLAWLAGTLSAEEARALELQMGDDAEMGDAMEGLHYMGEEETKKRTARLNYKLEHLLKEKKSFRRGIGDLHWIWMSVFVVLLLAIAAFCVLYFMNKR